MKVLKYILPAMLFGAMLTSCDTDVEPETVIDPYTYSPQYYQNLRDYKKSDHSIAWGWFADYTQTFSPATRFTGLPDSLDICSLWGGIPSSVKDRVDTQYLPEVEKEMRFVQKEKGTKFVAVTIIRIRPTEYYELYQQDREAGLRAYANSLIRPIFENDLDGIDLDYEPEGDPLSGSNLDYFVKYIGQFIGKQASKDSTLVFDDGFTVKGDNTKIFCIDYYGAAPSANTNDYVDYYVNQTYGGSAGGKPFGSCPSEKVVYTENVGDSWKSGCGRLLEYAKYKPATGRKGGFGAFFMHRDYINTGYGFANYANIRYGIQLQNPAIH